MLNLKVVTLIVVSLFISTVPMQAKSALMDKNLEKDLVKICLALKSNSKTKLRKAIKNSGLHQRAILRGLVCNGMDPVSFALSNNANLTASYIARKKNLEYIASVR